MVIDTSAILAILRDEPKRRRFNQAIDADHTRLISAASFVEASIIMQARHGDEGVRLLDVFLARAGIELAPVDGNQAHIARQAQGYSAFKRNSDESESHPPYERREASCNDAFSWAISAWSSSRTSSVTP